LPSRRPDRAGDHFREIDMQRRNLFSAFGALMLAASLPAAAKCTVTLAFTNGEGTEITVLGDESQSRVNGGLWSKMSFSNAKLAAGQSRHVPWTPDLSCGGNAKRDLRFKYQKSSNNQIYEEMVDNIDLVDGSSVRVTLNN
jgi:hypothetical protein